MVSLLKGLSTEKIVLLDSERASKLPFALKGIVRLVDKKGHTLAFVLDQATLEEIEEDIEAFNPGFLESLESSRGSGRVPGKEVKRKSRLK